MNTNTVEFPGQELRRPDAQGRIAIGKELANETYSLERKTNGDIVLRPVVVIHKQEQWLFANPEVLASVKLGLQQSAAGQVKDLGSFAKYATDDEDEDDE